MNFNFTDRASLHIFSCSIQYMENDVVTVELYRMMEIDIDESAPAMVELVKENMIHDGIWEQAKKRLVTIATDGQAVL